MNLVKAVCLIKTFPSQLTRTLTSSRCVISKTGRKNYLRSYQTVVVNPDGSTFKIRYHEPREIITLPFDLTNLSDSEKRIRLELRKPKSRLDVNEGEAEKVKYDTRKYLKYVKK